MFYHLLVAVIGTAALLGGWVAVQSLKRRSDPSIPQGEDVLACGRSCGGSVRGCAAMTAIGEPVEAACAANRKE